MACHRFHRFDSQALEDTTAIWEEYVLKLPQSSNLMSFNTLFVRINTLSVTLENSQKLCAASFPSSSLKILELTL
ncbi:MAG: hypothetical protein LH660_17000 [Phormidesmis sp. CAN_BIN36]|nr:hypothetical protein [Phormidesmis sp. CAN_BIN36]